MTILDLSGMRGYLDGDIEEEREIIQVFISKSQKDLTAIASAIEAQSIEGWGETCHSLKGSAALLGAEELRALCQICEDTKVFDKEALTLKLSEIQAAYGLVIAELAKEDLV